MSTGDDIYRRVQAWARSEAAKTGRPTPTAEYLTRHMLESFLAPPVHSSGYSTGMGTLYTAAYFPAEGRVEYRWPDHTWPQSFERFEETAHVETYAEPALAA